MPAAAAFVFIILPWLNPFSPGPTSAVGPFVFSWVCTALLLLAWAFERQRGQSETMVRTVALAWVTAAGLSAVIGLLQYFGTTAWAGVWLNHTNLGEAFGNLRQRNQFATLLNIGLVALVWLAASQPARVLPLILGLVALLGAGNAASSSRTGMFQLVLLLVLALWWQRRALGANAAQARRVRLVLLTALVAYVASTFVLPLMAGLDPFSSGAWARLRAGDALCFSRRTLWGNVLHLIGQKPWLGWGWGELDYAHFITLYPGARFCDILDNAHNLPLHLAVELGVPVAVLVCGAGLWLALRTQPWGEIHPTRQLAWGVLAVILLHSLLEYPLWYGPFQTAALLSVWLLWWVPRQDEALSSFRTYRPFRLLSPNLYAGAATVLIAMCAFTTWNYQLASQIYLAADDRLPAYRDNTIDKTRGVWLFGDQVRFAELTTTELTASNAPFINTLAKQMLHFSPESRVVELVLESAALLGRTDEEVFYAARYEAAFPKAYSDWKGKAP